MLTLSKAEAGELAQSVRAACERLASEERIREIAYEERTFDRELWTVLCQQIGVAAIGLPEELGGAGYGVGALGVVAHELGRTLAPVPFVATAVWATGLLADVGDTDRLDTLASAQRTAAVVMAGLDAQLEATPDGGRWRIRGSARHVLHGAEADEIVLVADTDDGPTVFAVDRAAAGLAVQVERVLDPTRPMASAVFDNVAVEMLGPAGAAATHNLQRAIAVLSAEQVGAHERILEILTDYARTRVQFGRPIGAFQAIKHRCADVLVNLEWSRTASLAALHAVDDGHDDASWLTSLAKAVCSEGLRDAAHANVQVHGGIGFTWEDAAHLYLKRARTDEVLFGGPATYWDRVARDRDLF